MTSFLTSKQSNFFGKRPQSCSKRHAHEFFCFPDLKNHFLRRFSRRSDLTQNGIVTPPHVPTRKPQNRPPFGPNFGYLDFKGESTGLKGAILVLRFLSFCFYFYFGLCSKFSFFFYILSDFSNAGRKGQVNSITSTM